MSVQCRRLTLMICSLSLSICSLSYLFIMISLATCQFNVYNIIFISAVSVIGILGTLYFAKLLLIGDSCCKFLAGIGVLLAIGGIIALIFTNHEIIADYGIGFNNKCQILTTLYLFGSLFLLVIIIIMSILYGIIVQSNYEEV